MLHMNWWPTSSEPSQVPSTPCANPAHSQQVLLPSSRASVSKAGAVPSSHTSLIQTKRNHSAMARKPKELTKLPGSEALQSIHACFISGFASCLDALCTEPCMNRQISRSIVQRHGTIFGGYPKIPWFRIWKRIFPTHNVWGKSNPREDMGCCQGAWWNLGWALVLS